MGISLRDLTRKDSFTMREVAVDRGFDYLPFSMRELVTPQLAFERRKRPPEGAPEPDTRAGDNPGEAADTRPGEQEGLRSTGNVRWANWLDDFPEPNSTRLEPENKRQLRKAMVNMIDVDGPGGRIRSVGSGHSHSRAAVPSSSFVDLRRYRNTSGTLDHGPSDREHGWLAVDEEATEPDGPTYIRAPEAHWEPDGKEPTGVVPKSNLARLKAGTMLKRLNRDILPTLGDTDENAPGKALINMGAWDGQTIAGAVNTGTHGTGVNLGAVSDAVRSVEIATVPEARSGVPIVQLFRIEPSDGITDRETFEADAGDHEMRLIQDDDVFHSVVVGYGCMGNVIHYTLEVRDAYWLQEWPKLRQWRSTHYTQPEGATSLSESLDTPLERARPGNEFLTRDPETDEPTRHLRVLLNLPAVQGGVEGDVDPDDPICLVIRRREDEAVAKPDDWGVAVGDDRWPPERPIDTWGNIGRVLGTPPHPLGEAARKDGGWAKRLRNNFFERTHKGSPTDPLGEGPFRKGMWKTASYIALRRLRDRKNYPPEPPQTDAISTAVAVPLDQLTDAVDRVIEEVQAIEQTERYDPDDELRERWNVYFSAPVGLRFVAGTKHQLSPEYSDEEPLQPRAMVEIPFPVPDGGFARQPRVGNTDYPGLSKGDVRDRVAKPALEQLERVLVEEFDGRPHMGKHFSLDADDLADLYPRFEGEGSWMESYRRFNAFGTFNNEFTSQLGISRSRSPPADPTVIDNPDGPSGGGGGDDEPQGTSAPDDGTDGTGDPGDERQGTSAPDASGEGAAGAEATSAAGPGPGVTGGLAGLAGLGAAGWLRDRLGGGEQHGDGEPGGGDSAAAESDAGSTGAQHAAADGSDAGSTGDSAADGTDAAEAAGTEASGTADEDAPADGSGASGDGS